MSEKLKIYSIYAHIFGNDPILENEIKGLIVTYLNSKDLNDVDEKEKIIWLSFDILKINLNELKKMVPRFSDLDINKEINDSTKKAFKILKYIKNEEKELQQIWLNLGDTELMNERTFLDYVNDVSIQNDQSFDTINAFLDRSERDPTFNVQSLSSLTLLISNKKMNEDQWVQILNRIHSISMKTSGFNDSKNGKKTTKFILENAITKNLPYVKISKIINDEIDLSDKDGNDFIERSSRILKVANLPTDIEKRVTNLFIKKHFNNMIQESKSFKMPQERLKAFTFLKNKQLSSESIRYLLSFVLGIDAYKEIKKNNFKAMYKENITQPNEEERPQIIELINNSELDSEEKKSALELLN